MKNVHARPRETRYSIDPIALMDLEDQLDTGEEIMVGIYHSHPDHPAKPSRFDLEYAWPNISYFVMNTVKGVTETMTSWKLDRKINEFVEEEIQII
jgi:proteasome lid subunit RPN8/RPN11